VKVFISSVITDYGNYRDAASHAAEVLGHQVIRAEDFAATARTPQQACLDGVRDADIVLLLLGDRYGATQGSGLSATHEEFLEASRTKPLLVFNQTGIERDEQMDAFVDEVHSWDNGRLSRPYDTTSELSDAVTRALADHAVNEQLHQVDDSQLAERAVAGATVSSRYAHATQLIVSIASGPTQALLRPADIDQQQFRNDLLRDAMFGAAPVIDPGKGAVAGLDGDRLELSNDDNSVTLSPLGDITVRGPAAAATDNFGMRPLIEEDVQAQIRTYIDFADLILQRIDPTGRIKRVAVAVGVIGEPMGWRTRADQAASPTSMTISMNGRGRVDPVVLEPSAYPRAFLQHRAEPLSEDFATLLRRRIA